MNNRKFDIIFISLFFILNIANTYMLTSQVLNRYIITFNHTFFSEISSLIGNIAVLATIVLIGVLIFRKTKYVAIYLAIMSLALNIGIIALCYYTKSYNVAFSIFNFSIIRNPSGGFEGNMIQDVLMELFTYYRAVCLLPFIILLILFFIFKKRFSDSVINISFKKVFCFVVSIVLLQVSSYSYYHFSLNNNWKCSVDYAQYGCQHAGVYNYYLSELIFRIDNRNLVDEEKDLDEVYRDLEVFNKNQQQYTNFIDNKTYSIKDKQTGILKDKNVFVIQLESTMSFVYNSTFNNIEISPYFNNLFLDDNCFYFDNVYTSVGIGNTSDAEFSFFTGFFPTGDMTIAWEFYDYDFQMKALGDYLTAYDKYSYNPTTETFYNHKNVHEQLYKMNSYLGLETFQQLFPFETNQEKYLTSWISDQSILDWARKNAINSISNNKNVFSFVETITPHNPFPDLSTEYEDFTVYDFELGFLNYQLENYLNQVKYNDKLLFDFLMDVTNPNSDNYMEDTVFILYGDHGNALGKSAYEELYKRELTDWEYQQIILKIPVIFYDPSGELSKSLKGTDLDKVLHQLKSTRDLNRTLMNLLGVESEEYEFGVNLFSGEPSFAYNPKNYMIFTDDFFYSMKNEEHYLLGKELDMDVVKKISDYRYAQDLYINMLVYGSEKKVHEE